MKMERNSLLSSLLALCCLGQFDIYAQDILWERSLGGKHGEYLFDAQPTPDYGFIVAGSSFSGKTGTKSQQANGNLDYWIWKMDESGESQWQKSFGGSGNDLLYSIRLTTDGGFILAGTSSSPAGMQKKESSRGGDDFWILKLDAKGSEQWQKTIGGSGQEILQSLSQTTDGGFILGGTSSSPIDSGEKSVPCYGNADYWIVKLDINGEIQWQQSFGGNYLDELRSIEQTFDKGYIVGGYSNSTDTGNKTEKNVGDGDYWVLKLSMTGEIEWQKVFGGDHDDQLSVVHQTIDGNYILGGSSNSNYANSKTVSNSNGTDFWIIKIDGDGNNLWQETYNIGKLDILTSLVENKDHTLLLGGFAKSEIAGTNKKKNDKEINDFVAIKINEKGEELWRQSVGSDGEDVLRKVIETRDGGYLLAGTSDPAETGNNNGEKKVTKKSPGSLSSSTRNSDGVGNEITKNINEEADGISKEFNEGVDKYTNTINNALGSDENSSIQYGLNNQSYPLKSPLSTGPNSALDNLLPSENQQASLPASRDKFKSYGSKDFWVVKIKDKDKPTKIKVAIEAIPNPTNQFTNIIIGFDYQSGTATVVDLAGHTLETFTINERTVPIDLSHYPDGIYIVNIRADNHNEGVKVVKGGNK